MKALLFALALTAFAPMTWTQTAQELVDAAPPRSVVIIRGGTWPPLTVRKALTIVCLPAARFEMTPNSFASPIVLDGPKTGGTVALYNVRVGGQIPYTVGQSSGGISGGGFDSLEVYHSEIRAPEHFSVEGVGFGVPAINVRIPDVLVYNSIVSASSTIDDACANEQIGAAGILAPGAVVTLVDSQVSGSSHRSPCVYPFGETCPPPSGHLGAHGDAGGVQRLLGPPAGPGVEAGSLELHGASASTGGPSWRWLWHDTSNPSEPRWRLCQQRTASGLPFEHLAGSFGTGAMPVEPLTE